MTTEITMNETTEAPRELHGAGIVAAASGPFVPVTEWPALEAARERHERALTEYREARREEALATDRHRAERRKAIDDGAGRVLDGEPTPDAAAAEDARRRELEQIGVRIKTARQAQRQAVVEALRLIEAHPEWVAEVAARRAAAEAEHADLLAQAQAAKVRAHSEHHLEAWLIQAATKAAPRPYRGPGPLPPAPQTVAELFGGVAA